jgi:hypothetical protein
MKMSAMRADPHLEDPMAPMIAAGSAERKWQLMPSGLW